MDLRHVSLTKNVSHQGYFFSIGEIADLHPRPSLSLICRHYSGIAGGNQSCWLLFAPLALQPFLELLWMDHFFLTAQEGRGMAMGQRHGKGSAIHDLLQRQNFIYLQVSAHPCEAAQFLPPGPACKDEVCSCLGATNPGKGQEERGDDL